MKKIILTVILTMIWISLISASSIAATIKCSDYANSETKMQKEMKTEIETLNKVRKQIDSTKTAINDFNKKCHTASTANCNPAMFSMMTSQIPLLSGQESNLETKIANLKMKSIEAHDNWTACKQTMAIRK